MRKEEGTAQLFWILRGNLFTFSDSHQLFCCCFAFFTSNTHAIHIYTVQSKSCPPWTLAPELTLSPGHPPLMARRWNTCTRQALFPAQACHRAHGSRSAHWPATALPSQRCPVHIRGGLAAGFPALWQVSNPAVFPDLGWVRSPLRCQSTSEEGESQPRSPYLSSLLLAQFTSVKGLERMGRFTYLSESPCSS